MNDVTVLMPVYNGAPFIRQAIDSILGQTFREFKFVIIDDGSTDDSARIAESYLDPRIRLIRNDQNLGLSRSLNRGLALARGGLVARQDADDISSPNRLARQAEFLAAHPDITLVGSAYEEIDTTGRVVSSVTLPCAPDEIRWALFFYCPLVHGAVTMRKSALEDLGGYSENYAYAGDYELWTRMAPNHRMANLEDVLVQYRVSQSSMTSTYPAVTTEPQRIGLAALRELTGWEAAGTPSLEQRHRDMQCIFRTESHNDAPRYPDRARLDILRLHEMFCGRYAIPEHRCRALHRDLVFRLWSNLAHYAVAESRAGRYIRAVNLIASAVRLRTAEIASGIRVCSGDNRPRS